MSALEQAPPRPDSALAGALVIDDRVVERIAVVAAQEVDGVLPAPAHGLRRLVRPSPRVDADASQDRDQSVAIELVVSVRYPLPVFGTAAAVRERVISRVRDLCGRTVERVDIHVDHMTHPSEEPHRRVR